MSFLRSPGLPPWAEECRLFEARNPDGSALPLRKVEHCEHCPPASPKNWNRFSRYAKPTPNKRAKAALSEEGTASHSYVQKTHPDRGRPDRACPHLVLLVEARSRVPSQWEEHADAIDTSFVPAGTLTPLMVCCTQRMAEAMRYFLSPLRGCRKVTHVWNICPIIIDCYGRFAFAFFSHDWRSAYNSSEMT